MIEIKDVESFKKSISAISSFIAEGSIRFNDSGIHLRGIDPSQVVLVDFSMTRDSFKKFAIEPVFVGVDLVEFNKIVSRVAPEESLSLDLSESELKLSVSSDFERNFNIPLIDASQEEVALPKVKFEASVEINARTLKELLKDASVFGSLVVFSVKKNSFIVQARGSHGQMNAESQDTRGAKVLSSRDVTAKFSLNFLQNIVREVALEEKILLELKNDAPVKVSYSIGLNRFEFFLAHMIL